MVYVHGASEHGKQLGICAKLKNDVIRNSQVYSVVEKPEEETSPENTIPGFLAQAGAGESCPRDANQPEKNQALSASQLTRFSKRRAFAKSEGFRTHKSALFPRFFYARPVEVAVLECFRQGAQILRPAARGAYKARARPEPARSSPGVHAWDLTRRRGRPCAFATPELRHWRATPPVTDRLEQVFWRVPRGGTFYGWRRTTRISGGVEVGSSRRRPVLRLLRPDGRGMVAGRLRLRPGRGRGGQPGQDRKEGPRRDERRGRGRRRGRRLGRFRARESARGSKRARRPPKRAEDFERDAPIAAKAGHVGATDTAGGGSQRGGG